MRYRAQAESMPAYYKMVKLILADKATTVPVVSQKKMYVTLDDASPELIKQLRKLGIKLAEENCQNPG